MQFRDHAFRDHVLIIHFLSQRYRAIQEKKTLETTPAKKQPNTGYEYGSSPWMLYLLEESQGSTKFQHETTSYLLWKRTITQGSTKIKDLPSCSSQQQ